LTLGIPELNLDDLLRRIVAVAGKLVGARYAALGVLNTGSKRGLATFIHDGIPVELAGVIGELPSGHGLLGLIIDEPRPLRLHDMGEHQASFGFPKDHPPMRSFLGVPVRTRDQVFGNLYLTEKEGGGDFTEQDERIVVALAAAAGVAVENARLRDDARRRERWLSATAEITGLLLGAIRGGEALQLVVDRALEVAEADAVWIATGDSEASGTLGHDTPGEDVRVQAIAGLEIDLTGEPTRPLGVALARQVIESGVPVVVEDLSGDAPLPNSWPQLGPAILVPLRDPSGIPGVLVLAWMPHHDTQHKELDWALPARFAEQAALALQLTRAQRDRQRLAVFEDRDRIGRDLHDLVIQRLFAVGLSLQGATRLQDSGEVSRRLELAVDDLDTTIKDIRTTIFALGAPEAGVDLEGEVTRLVDRAAAAFQSRPSLVFEADVGARVGAEEAPDLLAVLSEALSNAARHANASRVEVRVWVDEGDVTLEVRDDGGGIPVGVTESGLRNMRLRAERRGGSCEILSAETGGTHVRWRIPVS
ncbi:MAG: GAF domain-containing sensor histidine kinase, partial [Marmoricola sp.]